MEQLFRQAMGTGILKGSGISKRISAHRISAMPQMDKDIILKSFVRQRIFIRMKYIMQKKSKYFNKKIK